MLDRYCLVLAFQCKASILQQEFLLLLSYSKIRFIKTNWWYPDPLFWNTLYICLNQSAIIYLLPHRYSHVSWASVAVTFVFVWEKSYLLFYGVTACAFFLFSINICSFVLNWEEWMLCLCGREYCRGKAGMENMGEQGCNGLLLPPYPLCTSMT